MGRPDDGGDVNGVAAPRDTGKVERGEAVFERVVPGVIPERSFGPNIVEIHITFQHDFRVGGRLQVNCLALDQFDRFPPQETREEELVQVLGQRQNAGDHRGRIGADGHRDIHPPAFSLAFEPAEVFGAAFVDLPVHAGCPGIENLHAVASHVPAAGPGALRDHQWEGDEAPAILRPAFHNR